MLLRAAATAGVLAGLALAVGAATDEGGVPWAERAARVAPLTPLLGLGAAWMAQRRARSRGDVAGLEALGVPPWALRLPAAAGGAALGLATAVALAAGAALAAFYPRPPLPPRFLFADGRWIDAAHGMVVDPDGALAIVPATAAPEGVAHGSPAVAATTVLLASVTFAWVGTSADARPPLVAPLVAFASLLAFQGASAGVVPAWLPIAPAALFAAGLLGAALAARLAAARTFPAVVRSGAAPP